MIQSDLNELTQYLEQSVMLVDQKFNVITSNWRLNVLAAVQEKQKAKNIKVQAELLEKPSLDLEETTNVKKECKEFYC